MIFNLPLTFTKVVSYPVSITHLIPLCWLFWLKAEPGLMAKFILYLPAEFILNTKCKHKG